MGAAVIWRHLLEYMSAHPGELFTSERLADDTGYDVKQIQSAMRTVCAKSNDVVSEGRGIWKYEKKVLPFQALKEIELDNSEKEWETLTTVGRNVFLLKHKDGKVYVARQIEKL